MEGEDMKGAIICGYQGIGKSTLANVSSGYIDLESSNFWVNGERDEHWYEVYCNIAIHLAKQGYRVFMSSHEVVRKHLASLPTDADVIKVLCFPSPGLKSAWTRKLEERFLTTGLVKDWKAWKNADDRYADNIKELVEQDGFAKAMIINMDYKLEIMLDMFLKNDDDENA